MSVPLRRSDRLRQNREGPDDAADLPGHQHDEDDGDDGDDEDDHGDEGAAGGAAAAATVPQQHHKGRRSDGSVGAFTLSTAHLFVTDPAYVATQPGELRFHGEPQFNAALGTEIADALPGRWRIWLAK